MLRRISDSKEYINKYQLPLDCVFQSPGHHAKYKFATFGALFKEDLAVLFWTMLYHYSGRTKMSLTYIVNNQKKNIPVIDEMATVNAIVEEIRDAAYSEAEDYSNQTPVRYILDNSDVIFDDDVILIVNTAAEGYIELFYDSSLFALESMQRFEDNLSHIITQYCKAENQKIVDYDPVCNAEKRMLRSFNNKTFDWNTDETFIEAFYRLLEIYKDNIAHSEGDLSLTFSELNVLSNYYASQIDQIDSEYVGIYLKSDIAATIAILAILKAGKVIVTINPSYPKQRIEEIVGQLDLKMIIVCEKTESILIDKQIVDIVLTIKADDYHENIYVNDIKNFRNPDDICYIIYTSGTTGNPKGVKITHRNIMIELRFAKHFFSYNEKTRSLHILNYSFDFGLYDFFISLFCGGTLYSLDKSKISSFKSYLNYIEHNKIDSINTTPSFFNIISSFKYSLPLLRVVHLGGEKVTYQMINNYYCQILSKSCTVYNGYGPCEVTIGSAIHPVNFNERIIENQILNSVPIGPPTDDSYMYVLDDSYRMMPINAVGELYVGGKGVGKGYVDESKNEGKFVNLANIDEGVLYRTGDMVRWLPNGRVEFFGRKDSQVKINGIRIELSEIDNLLTKHNCVKQSKTICVSKGNNNKLVTFITQKEEISVELLKDYLAKRVPVYMIPTQLRIIMEFPMLTSGKIDEKKLKLLYEVTSYVKSSQN